MTRTPLVFDMETRDPDDVMALCLIAAHPGLQLMAVTITPGTPEQIGIVRHVLERLGCQVPVGARATDSPALAVSQFHRDWLGRVADSQPDGIAHEILAQTLTPAATLLTGAPLQNLRLLLKRHREVRISRWVAQGGFAGDFLVPETDRLSKFAGREFCESFNFGGDKKATLEALRTPRIGRREFVSKNVTHGVAWDEAFQQRVRNAGHLTAGATMVLEAMDVYLHGHPEGKLLHDPLAVSAVVDPGCFRWAEVEVLYQSGRWGSAPVAGTNTFITTGVDRDRAFAAMLAIRL